VFTSVSYNYPGRVPVVANATNGVATVPYPSIKWPPISDDSTVAFVFLPPDMPDAAKTAFSTIPFGSKFCPNGAAGCPFKFTLTKFKVDIGPRTDYSGIARRYATSENGALAWVIHIPELDLRQLFADDWNYIIDMEWTFAGVTYKTSQALMKRGEKFAGSYFEKNIYPTFLSERCQTCHSMGDHDTIIQHHDSKGVHNLDGYSTDLVGPGPHEVCQNCHFPPRVSDWRTPPFAQGIDWKTMTSWQQICNTAVSHLSAGALIEAGVQTNMRNHFHNDPRVKWAISDAMTFPPVIEQLTRAPPGNWDAWLKIIDPWIEMTDRCSPG
jgi:hypothetical protein